MSVRVRSARPGGVTLYTVIAPKSKHPDVRVPMVFMSVNDALKRMSWLRAAGNPTVLKVSHFTLGLRKRDEYAVRFGPEYTHSTVQKNSEGKPKRCGIAQLPHCAPLSWHDHLNNGPAYMRDKPITREHYYHVGCGALDNYSVAVAA